MIRSSAGQQGVRILYDLGYSGVSLFLNKSAYLSRQSGFFVFFFNLVLFCTVVLTGVEVMFLLVLFILQAV